MTGQVRTMAKWYPWSRGKIFLYKLVRAFHAVFFVLINLTSSARGIISGPTLGYFAATLSMLIQLLNITIVRERWVKEQTREGFVKPSQQDPKKLEAGLISEPFLTWPGSGGPPARANGNESDSTSETSAHLLNVLSLDAAPSEEDMFAS